MLREIGVGILSHNRLLCLKHLVESIRRTRDYYQIDLLVGEDSTDTDECGCRGWLNGQEDIRVLLNSPAPFGVAGNSNVLLDAMKEYSWKFLLNDDLVVTKHGWTNIYTDMMPKAGLHHCSLELPMLYGGKKVEGPKLNGVDCLKLSEKPQGHCLVLDQKAFETVGYFDEKLFPRYGFEHVDWSNRVSMSEIQPLGFWDIADARWFFRSNDSRKANQGRQAQYKANAVNWEKVRGDRSRIFIGKEQK